jgi:hypothetical protein
VHGRRLRQVGTVVGEWLQATYQDRLREIADEAHMRWTAAESGPWDRERNDSGLYGMSYYTHDGRVVIDGACGIESILRIGKAIGLQFARTYKTHGRSRGVTTGWVVTDTRPDAA